MFETTTINAYIRKIFYMIISDNLGWRPAGVIINVFEREGHQVVTGVYAGKRAIGCVTY